MKFKIRCRRIQKKYGNCMFCKKWAICKGIDFVRCEIQEHEERISNIENLIGVKKEGGAR